MSISPGTPGKLKDYFKSRNGGRWVAVDFSIGFFAMWSGLAISPYIDIYQIYNRLIVSVAFGFSLVASLRLVGLYAHRMQHMFSTYDILLGALQGALLAFILVGLVVNFTHVHVFGRYVATTALLISIIGVIFSRGVAKWHSRRNPLRVVLMGCNELTIELGNRVLEDCHFQVVFAACSQDCEIEEISDKFSFRKVESIEDFADLLLSEQVEVVISCYDHQIPKVMNELVEKLPFYHIDLINKGSFLETYFREVSVSYRNLHWQSSNFFKPNRGAMTSLKRLMDLIICIPLMTATLPLWVIVMLCVKLDSEGPVIYSQTRTGLLGRPFTIYKFRTMTLGAEANGPQWASKNDVRVTRVGAFLRKTRLDELPQLWNVLKGDMSLVGPRPERPEFVEMLKREIPLYDWRLLVKPGLTGWAQILFRYGDSVADARRKLQFDLYYVKNLSMTLDVQILIRTLHLLMKGSQ